MRSSAKSDTHSVQAHNNQSQFLQQSPTAGFYTATQSLFEINAAIIKKEAFLNKLFFCVIHLLLSFLIQKKCHTPFSITLFYRKTSIFFSYHILFCKKSFSYILYPFAKVYKLLLKDLKKFLKLPYFCLSIRRLTEPVSRKYHRYLGNLTRFIVPERISDIDRKI